MAQGGVISIIPTSIASAGVMTIQPSAGVEWLIKNIYYSGAISLQKTDGGAHPITFDSDSSAGAKNGTSFLLTNTNFLTITNTNATTAIYAAYDGLITSS